MVVVPYSEGMTVRFRIHKLAAARDIFTIKDLAEQAGLDSMTVSRLWKNTGGRVDLATLDAISGVFECQPGELFEARSEEPEKRKPKKKGK